MRSEKTILRNRRPCSTLLIVLPAVVLILFTENVLAHSWMAPKAAADKQNPTPLSAVSINRGKAIYLESCAYCHGENLKGLKPAASGLQKDTPDLRQRLKTHTEGDFHWKIQTGKGEMPSFKEDLTDKEIWDIINFINGTDP